jgi:hypothetical protein
MEVGPELEAPQVDGADGGVDAVTIAFGDPGQRLYGLARLGLPGPTGMGVLFEGADVVAVEAEGVEVETIEPLRRWRARYADYFEVELEALSPPAGLDASHPAAKAGGMSGYEQLCRVRGTVEDRRIDCLGQRGHSWGRPDWDRIALARTVSAWLDDRTAVTLTAVRPAKGKHHSDEAVAAYVVTDGVPVLMDEPLLSTTYDAGGRHRHAGLELWPAGDDAYPHRAAGEVLCGTTLDLGRLRLDCAFFEWKMEGRTGVGRYDVLRRSPE